MMQSVKLNQVCKILNGYAFKSEEYQSEGVPLLRISNFDGGDVVIDDKSIYVDPSFLKTKTDFIVEKGDILIALSGATTGKYGIYNYDFPSLLNQRIGLIKSSASSKLSGKFFYHFLNILKDEILRKAGGAAQPNVSTKTIGELEIPLLPLPQQQKIANILDAADELRQNDNALIAKYDELTQALFLDMFGDPVNSKIIELGEVIKLIGGGTPSKLIDEYWIGTIPWASVKDLKSDLLTSTIDHISEAAISNSATNLIPAGSLIIATRMAVGKSVICLKDTAINQDLKGVKIVGEANVKFLQHLFKSKESYFDSVSSGATVKGIKIEHITKLKVPFPPIELQNQFAERVAVIEEQKAIAQKSLEKSESLFNSLLQKAFKGELV